MKINITLDIDFINEDDTLEESFKNEIRDTISRRIVDGATKTLINEVKPIMDKHFKESIDKTMENLLNDYLNKPVTISDGYKAENYDSALEMIRIKFSSLYDAEFKRTAGCNNDPLIKKLTDKIKYEVQETLSKTSRVIESEAKKIAQDEISKNSLIQALEQINKK